MTKPPKTSPSKTPASNTAASKTPASNTAASKTPPSKTDAVNTSASAAASSKTSASETSAAKKWPPKTRADFPKSPMAFAAAIAQSVERSIPPGRAGAIRAKALKDSIAFLKRQLLGRKQGALFLTDAQVQQGLMQIEGRLPMPQPDPVSPGYDAHFMLAEMTWLSEEQLQTLNPKRQRDRFNGLTFSASDALRQALEAALDAAYKAADLGKLTSAQRIARRRARVESLTQYLLASLPGQLWGGLEDVLDLFYIDWEVKQEAALTQILPDACPVPLHVLLSGRYQRWRPHKLLHRWLNEQSNLRDDSKRLDAAAKDGAQQRLEAERQGAASATAADLTANQQDLFVQLIAPRSKEAVHPLTGKPRTKNEADELKDKLAEPRRLERIKDVDAAIASLFARFPWFDQLLVQLRRDILGNASHNGGAVKFAPFLLVGPPGIGKTRFMRELANAFDLTFHRVDRAGETDNRDFTGTAKGWHSAEVSLPVRVLSRIDIANPLIFIDEIDKEAPDSRNGAVGKALLALLEQETARTWQDPCLGEAVDLSHINWALGANSLLPIRGPLLSRLTIHNVEGPRPEHFDALLDSILLDLLPKYSGEREMNEGRQTEAAGKAYEQRAIAGQSAPSGKTRTTKIAAWSSNKQRNELDLFPEVRARLRHKFTRQGLSPRNLAKIVEGVLLATHTARVRGRMQ